MKQPLFGFDIILNSKASVWTNDNNNNKNSNNNNKQDNGKQKETTPQNIHIVICRAIITDPTSRDRLHVHIKLFSKWIATKKRCL